MSCKIKVDHSQFEPAAVAVDEYVSSMKRKMNTANAHILSLRSDWSGEDYHAFLEAWGRATNEDSVYKKMVKSLESYADYLRYAGSQYKQAQTDAVNRANKL